MKHQQYSLNVNLVLGQYSWIILPAKDKVSAAFVGYSQSYTFFFFRNLAKYERISLNRHAVELTGAYDIDMKLLDVATIFCEAYNQQMNLFSRN